MLKDLQDELDDLAAIVQDAQRLLCAAPEYAFRPGGPKAIDDVRREPERHRLGDWQQLALCGRERQMTYGAATPRTCSKAMPRSM